MQSITDFTKISLYRKPIDFRKQINGLCLLVKEELEWPMQEKHLFVFTNKRKDRIKIIYWNRTGFALWIKRLEENRFKWPKLNQPVIVLNHQELTWLLDGCDINRIKPHKALHYQHLY